MTQQYHSNIFPRLILMTNRSVQDQIVEKILSFAELEDGWHFDKGKAPSQALIGTALRILKEMNFAGFSATDAFPGVEDEILVVAYCDHNAIEVLCKNEKTFDVCIEENGMDDDEQNNIDKDQLSTIIGNKAIEWMGSLDYSTKNIMTPIGNVSSVSFSGSPHVVEVSPLSPSSAFNLPIQPIANISENIIKPESQVTRQYTGRFRAT